MGDDQFEPGQAEARLKKLLGGAFAGPPTPLKEIPKKSGVTRAARKDEPQDPRPRRQRKKRAA